MLGDTEWRREDIFAFSPFNHTPSNSHILQDIQFMVTAHATSWTGSLVCFGVVVLSVFLIFLILFWAFFFSSVYLSNSPSLFLLSNVSVNSRSKKVVAKAIFPSSKCFKFQGTSAEKQKKQLQQTGRIVMVKGKQHTAAHLHSVNTQNLFISLKCSIWGRCENALCLLNRFLQILFVLDGTS